MQLTPTRVSAVGPRPVLLLTAGLWSCVWLVFTARSMLQVDDIWLLALARAFNCVMGGLLSYGIYLVLRTQAHRRFVLLLAVALLLSMGTAVVYGMLAQEITEFVTQAPPRPQLSYIDLLLERTQASPWIFLAWCTGFLALAYNERLRDNELRMIELQALATAAENQMLRYQIQPHFLFNTLTALSTLILDRENERAERMVMALSRFMRHSLMRSPQDRVQLKAEVEAQEQYLGIEKERFGDRLNFVKDIAPDTERLMVPSLILQPLIENAVKYAVAATGKPTTIQLTARRQAGSLEITVNDNGPTTVPPPSGLGLGLANVRRRLEVAYGDRASFEHGPRFDGGYGARLTLPIETQ